MATLYSLTVYNICFFFFGFFFIGLQSNVTWYDIEWRWTQLMRLFFPPEKWSECCHLVKCFTTNFIYVMLYLLDWHQKMPLDIKHEVRNCYHCSKALIFRRSYDQDFKWPITNCCLMAMLYRNRYTYIQYLYIE